ncbi:hypothetical protein E2C01_015573 [Portunus trituberculatus]|uniref:Uncharacterized protein n=1 Tax=Portunus trituberculatus TaxID=210409 RepID=A0A5B7DN58_PORTR|nr:hypothetical protein [Portunus trituberculatus]
MEEERQVRVARRALTHVQRWEVEEEVEEAWLADPGAAATVYLALAVERQATLPPRCTDRWRGELPVSRVCVWSGPANSTLRHGFGATEFGRRTRPSAHAAHGTSDSTDKVENERQVRVERLPARSGGFLEADEALDIEVSVGNLSFRGRQDGVMSPSYGGKAFGMTHPPYRVTRV